MDGKNMKYIVRLKAKAYSYLIDDDSENKKSTKKWAIKWKFKFGWKVKL